MFGCPTITENNLECKETKCETVNFQKCFVGDCNEEKTLAFDVSNTITNTKGAVFKVTRSGGDCDTPFPTLFPSKSPTQKPTKNPTNPTPEPTFGCAGTFEFCGGDDTYIGATCW